MCGFLDLWISGWVVSLGGLWAGDKVDEWLREGGGRLVGS